MYRVGVRQERCHQRVAGLVVSSYLLFFFIEHVAFALGAEHHLFYTADKVVLRYRFAVLPRGKDGALVHQRVEVRPAEARCALGHHLQVDVLGERLFARVDFEYLEPVGAVGQVDGNAAVKTAGAQERGVQNVGAVGCGHDYYLFVRLKAVHLHQNLVEGLLALVIAAAHARAAHAAHGVNLVYEDDGGRGFFGGQKEVAHAAGAHTDKHLHKLRTRDRVKGHSRLPRHRPGKQRLAGAGRAHEQNAFGDARADVQKLFRIFEEVDNLEELLLGLFGARDVFKRNARGLVVGVNQPRLALAKGERLHPCAFDLAR